LPSKATFKNHNARGMTQRLAGRCLQMSGFSAPHEEQRAEIAPVDDER